MRKVVELLRRKLQNNPFDENSKDEFTLGYNEALQQVLLEVELLDFATNAPLSEVDTKEYAESL